MLDINHVLSEHKANLSHRFRKRSKSINGSWTLLLLITMVLLVMQGCGTTDSDSGFTLNVSVSPEEAGVVTPRRGAFDKGSGVELNVEPADGWIFLGWEGEHRGDDDPVTLLMDSDKDVTALFTRRQYDLSLEIQGEGRVREEVVEPAAKAEYDHGTTVQLTAEAADGWEFAGWEGDLEGSENPQTITIDQPKQVTAIFEPNEASISTSVGTGEGEIRIEPEKEIYLIGDEVTVTAVPAENFRFESWEGDFEGEEASFTVELEGEMTFTVNFTNVLLPLWAMGYNHNGQLGDGTRESRQSPVQGGSSFFEVENVAAGGFHSLILSMSGELLGMGYNGHGQLGIGSTADQVSPVSIMESVTDMSAGENHSLFIRDGNLWAMGANQYGQLGDGSTSDRNSPVEVRSGVEKIAAGEWHSLFITTSGELWGMGNSDRGQLGFVSEAPEEEEPEPDPGNGDDENGEDPGDGEGEPGDGDGEPGDGEGEPGDGEGDDGEAPEPPVILANPDPVRVDHGVTVTDVAAGLYHTLFVDSDGVLWGLGSNTYGQLGDHPRGDYNEPVEIARNVDRVAAGRDHSMYISNGNLYVMGNNIKGQLGTGTVSENQFEPVQVASGVEFMAGGLYHTLYVTSDGTLYGMGENDPQGQLGIEGGDQSSPVEIATNVRRIAAGVRHSLFIKDIQ